MHGEAAAVEILHPAAEQLPDRVPAEIGRDETYAQPAIGAARRRCKRNRPLRIGLRHRRTDEGSVAALRIRIIARLIGQEERLLLANGGGDRSCDAGHFEIECRDRRIERRDITRACRIDGGWRVEEDRQFGKARAQPRADIRGIEFQRTRIGILCPVAIIAVGEQRAEIGVRDRKLRCEQGRAAQCLLGFVERAAFVQHGAEVVPQIGRIVLDGHAAAISGDRRIERATPVIGRGPAAPTRARSSDRAGMRARSTLRLPRHRLRFQTHALLDECLNKICVELGGARIGIGRFAPARRHGIRMPKIRVGRGGAGIEPSRLRKGRDRLVGALQL